MDNKYFAGIGKIGLFTSLDDEKSVGWIYLQGFIVEYAKNNQGNLPAEIVFNRSTYGIIRELFSSNSVTCEDGQYTCMGIKLSYNQVQVAEVICIDN